MSRIGRAATLVVGLLAAFLVFLAFDWGGWAGEAALMLALVILVGLGLVLCACRIRRSTRQGVS
jgi:uncharacterized membrane protein YdcZ (DUF606 family)